MLSRFLSVKRLISLALPVIAFLFGHAGASFAQSDVCVPAIGGLAVAPTIDGVVDGDPGWNGAVRLNLKEALGVNREGTMQLGRAGGFLYISFEVETTPTPGYEDLVVLAFGTTGSATQDWRVHIHPFTNDDLDAARAVYQNDVPRTRDFWRNSTTWNLNSTATPTAGTADTPSAPFIGEIKVSKNANTWAMEMKIPTSGNIADAAGNTYLYLPPSPTTFKLYVNVLSTFDLAGTFTQDPWPQSVEMLTSGAAGSGGNYAQNRTPARTTWGTASIFQRTACAGVYLASSTASVGVRHNPSGTIGYTSQTGPGPFRAHASPTGTVLTTAAQCETDLDNNDAWPAGTTLPNNYFVAKPGNDGSSSASRVYVKFYVAPWGIPGAFDAGAPDAYWQPVGELYKPTGASTVHSTPEATIPPDVGGLPALPGVLTTPSWQLSYKQACVYTKSYGYGMLGHHCIQAEAHSNDAGVVIRNKSIQINHNFVEASVARSDTTISVKGRGKSAEPGKPHEMILLTQTLLQTFKRDGSRYYPVSVKGQETAALRTAAMAVAGVPAQFKALGPVPADLYPKGLDEGMTVITTGYLKRPDSMIIGGRSYQYAQYVGGYSYFAGHAGVAQNWVESLALDPGTKTARGMSASLQSLDTKTLKAKTSKSVGVEARILRIPEDDTVTLAATAEAQEAGQVTPEPPCGCLDFACRNRKADAGEAVSVAGLFLIGGIGIGGLAFVRRRKGDQGEAEDRDRVS